MIETYTYKNIVKLEDSSTLNLNDVYLLEIVIQYDTLTMIRYDFNSWCYMCCRKLLTKLFNVYVLLHETYNCFQHYALSY